MSTMPNALGPNATMFDFGGGVNMNPMPNGGSMGTGPNAVPNIAPTMPNAVNRSGSVLPHTYDFGNGGGSDLTVGLGSGGNSDVYWGGIGTGGINGNGTVGAPGSVSTIPSPTSGTTGANPSLTGGTLPFYTGAGSVPGNLSQIFGPLGPYILNAIQTGGYNPAVFDALVAQLQPQVNRGVATIGANAGASGTRFGSGYDLALGDYLSQVNLNEGSMAAGLYQNAVQNSFGLLQGISGDLSQAESNKGGFTSSLISSLISAIGPSLINKIPGLGGSSGGNNNGGNNSGSTNPFPGGTGINIGTGGGSIPYPPVYPTPTQYGTPNASDPFGNSLMPS